jgi:hypothetical protein
VQATDEEAVDPDQLARPGRLDVRLGLGVGRRLVGGPVASDERQPLGASIEPVAAERLPDAVRRHGKAAPFRPRELRRDPPRPEAWVPERERDDALLDDPRELVRHRRAPALPGPQHLEPGALDERLPAVVGRAVHTEDPAGVSDRRAARQVKQLQAVAEQHVILGHATPSLFGDEGA